MRVPLNADTIASQTRALIHGNDAHGYWDVEFKDVSSAITFIMEVKAIGWSADFRDSVDSVHSSVVVTIRELGGLCRGCGERYCDPHVMNFDCLKY